MCTTTGWVKKWLKASAAKLYLFCETLLYGILSILFGNFYFCTPSKARPKKIRQTFLSLKKLERYIKQIWLLKAELMDSRKFNLKILNNVIFKYSMVLFFLAYFSLRLYIYAVQLKTEEPLKNNFALKISPELKIANFLITILPIFWDSVIQSFLNFRFQ